MPKTREDIAARLFAEKTARVNERTDFLFGFLFVLQWVGIVAAALILTPRTWSGAASGVHIHVWVGVALGSLLCAVPLLLIAFRRGKVETRYVIAIAQLQYSALLVHLTGGRIESHFHIFGSLAFLAFYRDWKLLIPATLVTAVDHFVRGIFWPESVFGVLTASPWRAFEHAGWVLFEDVFLVISCVQAMRERQASVLTRADILLNKEKTEQLVKERTAELQAQSEELRVSEERLQLAVMGSQDGLWDWDLPSNKVYFAPRWKELLGYRYDEVSDEPKEWLGRIASEHLSRFDEALGFLVSGRDDSLDTEIKMMHADGKPRWMLCRAMSVRDDDDKVYRLAGSITDISELKQAQERMRQMAHHDRLTGLPNREVFTQRLDQAIERSRDDERRSFAVLFGDFDRFKIVNDSLGHRAGDELLISIAERFRTIVRADDIVARFGGDEFVVLLEGASSTDRVEEFAQRMVDVFSEPHTVQGQEVVSTVSLGVVLSDPSLPTAGDMLRAADAAMYQAKSLGKGCYQIFDEGMHAAAMVRLEIEKDLHAATRSDEAMDENFQLLYQPIVDLETGDIAGFESLIRWERPEKGRVGPDSFIPIAEESGAIIPIGEWTMRTACRQMAAWRDMLGPDRELTMHTNLSRRQLVYSELIPSIRRVLSSTGVRLQDFKLELTETALMDDGFDAVGIMQEIRKEGIELAMDDFGTGQSSLSCLQHFPIKTLKVDRAFLRHMTMQREFSAVMQAIITLASNLNLSVIAEGIEDAAQLSQLQAMDCEYAQGYYFSKPVTAEEATLLLRPGNSFAERKAA